MSDKINIVPCLWFNKNAEEAAKFTAGWKWWAALAILALIYFYAHYAFASITAHALAMNIPFLVVIICMVGAVQVVLSLLKLARFAAISQEGVMDVQYDPGFSACIRHTSRAPTIPIATRSAYQ